MKDIITVWSRVLGRSYSAVSTNNSHASDSRKEEFSARKGLTTDSSGRMPKKGKNYITSYFIIAVMGAIFFLSGLFILVVDPYEYIFKLKILFSDGGEVFEIWRKPPVDLYLRVYLFNVTNKDAFLRGEEKLKVVEVGPYVYKEDMSHGNITFNDNGTISAVPNHPLRWMPDLSAGDHERDQLVLPHIALLSIADVVSESSYFTKLGLNLLIRQTDTHPLVQMSPKEFMFGYPSTLMTLGNKFLPGWINFDKLGLIDRMYDFDGDYETVYTGETNPRDSGLLDTYNGSPQMPQWDGKCGYIKGASDGTKFKSHLTANDTLMFFRKSMCRPQFLIRRNKTESSGLQGYVYGFPENALDNGIINKENSCFCKTKKCLRRGLLDVRQCYYGFPIALSYPHFLDSDPTIAEEVEGYVSDRQKHQSYFVIQPKSGLPLDVAVRFQINMALGNIKNIAHVSRFDNMVLPLLWTEIRLYRLPDSLANRFKLYLNVLPLVTDSVMYMLFMAGVLLISSSIYKYSRRHKVHSSRPVNWLDDDVDDRMDRLLAKNYKPEKKDNMSKKELEVYFNSLVTPLNQDLDVEFHELQYRPFTDLKDID